MSYGGYYMNLTSLIPEPPVVPPATNVAKFTDQTGRGMPTRRSSLVLIDPAPYPEVTGSNDPETVKMIKEDYAGSVSELSAITQYIFQNTTTKDETFANAMLQIAIVEMTHLDMLGDAIETLGGTPSFDNGKIFWNASNVDYTQDPAGMLRANIKAESGAIASYEKHASLTKNASMSALFLRIAQDEKLHLKFFLEELAKLPK